MIRFTRTARLASGKTAQGVAYAKEIAAYASQVIDGDIQVFMQIGGPTGIIHWIVDHDNMAAWEAARTALVADETYGKMAAAGAEFVIEGSVQDTIIESL